MVQGTRSTFLESICAVAVVDDTPRSFVDLGRLLESVDLVRTAAPDADITLALKACYQLPLLHAAVGERVGASVFSELELGLARRAGFPDERIVFNGVSRTGSLLRAAIADGVRVSLESLHEVDALLEQTVPDLSGRGVSLRLNAAAYRPPGAAGKYEILGMDYDELVVAADRLAASGMQVTGLSFHAFANQVSANDHLEFLDRLSGDLSRLTALASTRFSSLNVGGGFASRSDITDERAAHLFATLAARVESFGLRPIFELGRFLVADTESVLSRVLDVRRTAGGTVAILDVTTNYLIPAPGHRFRVQSLHDGDPAADVLFVDRLGSEICRQSCTGLARDSLVAVVNAGAYAGVMKEQFVYPLPQMTFIGTDGTHRSLDRPDSDFVAAYHDWDTAEAWR